MKPIYEDAHDVHIRSNLVYAKAADKKLYYEAAYTNQVTQADLEDAFKKGTLLIVDGSKYLKAVELVGNIVKTLCRTGIASDAFDAAESYAVGDRVVHGGASYECKTAITLDDFSASSTYALNDIAVKDGVRYKCTTAIQVAADWDATKWTAISDDAAWDATKWTAIDTTNFIEWTAKAAD